MALAPSFDLFGVPSSSSICWSMRRCSVTSVPTIAGARLLLTLPRAVNTPFPPSGFGSSSRSSTASFSPVEAPEGTMAEAVVPSSRTTEVSTVGLPRESNTSCAVMFTMRMGSPSMKMLSILEGGDARKFLAFQKLQRGTSTCRDVCHPLCQPRLLNCGCRVTAADDGYCSGQFSEHAGDRKSPGSERLQLEDSHGAVPHHGPRGAQLLGETLRRLRSDV